MVVVRVLILDLLDLLMLALGGGGHGASGEGSRARARVRYGLVRKRLLPAGGRGLHSSTSRLNVSAHCGTGGANRGCVGGV